MYLNLRLDAFLHHTSNTTAAQLNEDEDRLLGFVMSILNDQHMYFSHDYDLTHSIQRVVAMNEDAAQRQVRSFVFCFRFASADSSRLSVLPLPVVAARPLLYDGCIFNRLDWLKPHISTLDSSRFGPVFEITS
jgi:hypothetical protein